MKIGRAWWAAAAGTWLGAVSGAGCAPQEIYLFDERDVSVVDAGGGNGGSGGGGGSAGAGEPAEEPRTPPPCESSACEACRLGPTPCLAESNLFCHPRTGECALGCDPEAADPSRECPLNQACHPVDGLCVECVTSASCTTGGRGVCDTQSDTCVECVTSASCTGPRPVCDTQARRCVECIGEQGCGELDVCNDETQQCVECVTLDDCVDDDAQLCFQSRCVECRTDMDCIEPDKPICSAELECEDED